MTATASTPASSTPASPSACSITGVTSSRWRRDATSGTTPPKRACSSSCEATTLERISPSALTTAAAVSSHDVSIPRIVTQSGHRSLCSGRLWRQVGALRRSTKSPCLLVEGATIYGGPVAHAAIRGTLLAIADLGVLVIRSENPEDSARWIHQLLERRASPRFRDRVPYAFRYARDAAIDPAEQALAAAPGISTIVARATLEHFGCLREVLTADLEALAQVPGVGTRRAQAIHDLAGGTRPSHSAKRNGVRRAT